VTSGLTLEDRLSAAFGEPMTAAERRVVDDRVTGILEGKTSPVRRIRPHLTRSLLLVAALLILLPAILAVSAAMLSTEAPFGMGSADQYDAELAAAKAVTPIPPGTTWPPYLERATDRNASYAVGLAQSMVEYNAFCMWLGYWHAAHERGDAAAVSAAVTALGAARGWETLSNPLTTDEAFRIGIQRAIDAAERGDAAVILRELELNCQGTWP
jgi:hypothetical protein